MSVESQAISTFESASLKQLVIDWIDGSVSNCGISLQFHDENFNDPDGALNGDTIASREAQNPDYIPPQLVIEYDSPSLFFDFDNGIDSDYFEIRNSKFIKFALCP